MSFFKILLTFFFTLFLNSLFSQDDEKKYWFKMDFKIDEIQKDLESQGVDTILYAFYHLDNGIGANATKFIFWKKDGKSYVNAVRRKGNDSFKDFGKVLLSNDSVFQFFHDNNLDTVLSSPHTNIWLSHNFGYSIDFRYGNSSYDLYLRNEIRRDDPTHLKSQWINIIDKIGRKYYE